MRMSYALFELFLCVLCIYALFDFEGDMRVTVPILCLVTVFLIEKLHNALEKTHKEVEIVQSVRDKMGKTQTK